MTCRAPLQGSRVSCMSALRPRLLHAWRGDATALSRARGSALSTEVTRRNSAAPANGCSVPLSPPPPPPPAPERPAAPPRRRCHTRGTQRPHSRYATWASSCTGAGARAGRLGQARCRRLKHASAATSLAQPALTANLAPPSDSLPVMKPLSCESTTAQDPTHVPSGLTSMRTRLLFGPPRQAPSSDLARMAPVSMAAAPWV